MKFENEFNSKQIKKQNQKQNHYSKNKKSSRQNTRKRFKNNKKSNNRNSKNIKAFKSNDTLLENKIREKKETYKCLDSIKNDSRPFDQGNFQTSGNQPQKNSTNKNKKNVRNSNPKKVVKISKKSNGMSSVKKPKVNKSTKNNASNKNVFIKPKITKVTPKPKRKSPVKQTIPVPQKAQPKNNTSSSSFFSFLINNRQSIAKPKTHIKSKTHTAPKKKPNMHKKAVVKPNTLSSCKPKSNNQTTKNTFAAFNMSKPNVQPKTNRRNQPSSSMNFFNSFKKPKFEDLMRRK